MSKVVKWTPSQVREYDEQSFARYNGRCGICGETYADRVWHLVTNHGWGTVAVANGQEYYVHGTTVTPLNVPTEAA